MAKRFQNTPPALRRPDPVSLDDAIAISKARAAQLTSVCEKTLELAVKGGELTAVKIGNRVLFRPADLRAWIDSRIVHNATSPAADAGAAV